MQGTSVASGETLSGGSEQHAGNTGKNQSKCFELNAFYFIFFISVQS